MPQAGWLILSTHLVLTLLQAGKSKIMVLADLVCAEGNTQLASWATVFTVTSEGGRNKPAFWGLFYETLFPVRRVLPSGPQDLPKSPTSYYHHVGGKDSIYAF